MIPIDIKEINKTLYFPENLAECDDRQFSEMAKLLYLLNSGKINYSEFRILSVYALLGLKKSKKTSSKKEENIYRISELVDNFFNQKETEDGLKLELKLDIVRNPYPKHKFLFRSYYGASDGFQNVSFGQYVDGLEEYIYFSQTGNMQALLNLFYIFYLPKNEKYNLEKSKARAKGLLRYTDIRHLYSFYLYFTSMQEYILGGQISVLGNDIDLSIIYQELEEDKGNKSVLPSLGLYSVMQDLAESGVFGNYNGVRETNMWLILLRLYELKKRRIDELHQEKKQKENKQ